MFIHEYGITTAKAALSSMSAVMRKNQRSIFSGEFMDSSASAKGMLERLPRPAVLAAGDALRDEVHAVHAVGDIGIKRVLAIEFLPGCSLDHVGIGGGVDVGEPFEKRFRMPRRDADRCRRRLAEVRRRAACKSGAACR